MSSDNFVAKKPNWKSWAGLLGSCSGIIALGLTLRNARIRKLESFDYAVRVAMESLKKGCFFTTTSATLVSSTMGYVERPPQDCDEMFDISCKSYSSDPWIIWAASGTGKSEYNMKMLKERGSYFMHLMCKGEGLSKDLVGETLGVHSCQHKNSFKILGKALSNLDNDQDIPRCLVVVEDLKIENALQLEKLHEWNREGICDLIVVLSERKDVNEILKAISGKQGRHELVAYLPPTKDSFSEALKKSAEGYSSFNFKMDDLVKLLDFVDVNFADIDKGLKYLDNGLSIEDTMLKLTEKFKVEVESSVLEGSMQEYINEDDMLSVILDLYNNGFLTDKVNLRAIAHLVDENILRTVGGHYTYQKKGIEIGVAAYLDSKKTEKEYFNS